MTFRLIARDGRARAGELETPHGKVETPAFMPVGTYGSVRAVPVDTLRPAGATILLCNAFHLWLRPGDAVIRELGGLHRFIGWDGPILTDSGGFQVHSLAPHRSLADEGVRFRSPLDGSERLLTPEGAMEVQRNLRVDVAMALDVCAPAPSTREAAAEAIERTLEWAARCRRVAMAPGQAVFGISQGGGHPDLRRACSVFLAGMGFEGYAVGGLGLGESKEQMIEALQVSDEAFPAERPRYLMGVGPPDDLLRGVENGIDLFDCVLPTRNARNGLAYVTAGKVRILKAENRTDPRPLEEGCPCPACSVSRAYLHQLFRTGDTLGGTLLSLHNLRHFMSLMRRLRQAILAGALADLALALRDGWREKS